jgi:hypothetical protein
VDAVSVVARPSTPSAAIPASAAETTSEQLDASSITKLAAGRGGVFTEVSEREFGKRDVSGAVRGVGCGSSARRAQ